MESLTERARAERNDGADRGIGGRAAAAALGKFAGAPQKDAIEPREMRGCDRYGRTSTPFQNAT